MLTVSAVGLTSATAGGSAVAAASALAPTVSRVSAVSTSTSPGVTIQGKGFGHGHGLSQWGAYGAASQGIAWQTIVGHYYPGTVLTAIGNPTIRVDVRGDLGQMAFGAASGLRASYGTTHAGLATLPTMGSDGSPITVFSVVPADATNARLVYSTAAGHSGTVGPVSPQINVTNATSGVVTAWAQTANRFGSVKGEFRGVMSSGAVVPVAAIAMDEYLRGVVPHESPAYWPGAALAAQAVAARSYAAYGLAHPRASSWDICDTTSCQVFQARAYYASTDAAVAATAGQALRYNGQPAFTEFGASTGGWNSAGSVPYLQAGADPWDVNPANPSNSWTVSVTASTIQARWPSIGTFQALTVSSRDGAGTWGGRVLGAVLQGTAGSVTLSGATLQSAFGLRSTYFAVAQTRPDLTGAVAAGTGGAVGLQTLLGASGFGVAAASVSTALTGASASQWRFLPGRRSDGIRPDLVAVRMSGGASGRVEVTTATSSSSYRTLTRAVTPFPAVAPDTTVQAVAGRTPGDLCLAVTGSTGSRQAELHCLSASSGYTAWVLHAATALPASASPATSRFLIVPSTGDLVWIPFAATGSRSPELHRMSAASGYHSWVDHRVLPLGLTTQAAATFLLSTTGSGSAPDVMFVPMANTGSGRVEVHVISAAAAYRSFSMHTATPVAATTYPAYQPFLG
ncbi:SpoIID/LytB domain-containing protein [Dermatophilaceae bacterium Soc4.6]